MRIPPRPRLRRKALWLAPAIAAGALGWLLVPSSASDAAGATGALGAPGAPSRPAAAGSPNGAALYDEHCSSCHGANGKGSRRAPSLEGVGMAEVDFQLQTGRMPRHYKGPKEPPYTPVLPEADIAALDRYVTALVAHGGPSIPSVNPAQGSLSQGGEVFRTYCSACHDATGSGGELIDRPVPKITEATPTEVGEAIRAGAVQMPKFGTAAISPTELNSVVAYVESLKHPNHKGGDPLSSLGPVAEGIVAWFIGMLVLLGLIRWIGERG